MNRPSLTKVHRTDYFQRLCNVALVAAALCWQVTAFAVSDDFSSGNDAAWTHSDVGFGGVQTFDASGFNYHLKSTVGASTVSYVGSFLGTTPQAGFTIDFDLVDWAGGAQKFGAYARATNINTSISGYMFSYQADTSQVLLRQMTANNSSGQNLSSKIVPLDNTKDYHFTFNGDGTNISGAIYEIGGPATPLVVLSRGNAVWTSGLVGVVGFGVGAPTDFTIDNFVAVVPEPTASTLVLVGALTTGWRLLRRRVILRR